MSKIIVKKDLDLVIESTLKEAGLVSEESLCEECQGEVCEKCESEKGNHKPDYIDLDNDGDKDESMKKAAKDKDDVVESSLSSLSESINQTTKKEFLKEEMDHFNKLINHRK